MEPLSEKVFHLATKDNLLEVKDVKEAVERAKERLKEEMALTLKEFNKIIKIWKEEFGEFSIKQKGGKKIK